MTEIKTTYGYLHSDWTFSEPTYEILPEKPHHYDEENDPPAGWYALCEDHGWYGPCETEEEAMRIATDEDAFIAWNESQATASC